MSRRRTATETVPSVNLLSPWVFEDLRIHRLRRRFVVGAIALVVLMALAWTGQRLNLHQADEELRGENAVTTGLSGQIAELAPVRTYVGGVQHRVEVIRKTAYDDVAFAQMLNALRAATPQGARLSSISVTLPEGTADTSTTTDGQTSGTSGASGASGTSGAPGAECPGPDPFKTKDVVGCVTIEGTAIDRETVGKLVIALGDTLLFVEPFVSTTTTSDSDGVTFSGSVGLSPKAYSGRYDSLGGDLTPESTKENTQ